MHLENFKFLLPIGGALNFLQIRRRRFLDQFLDFWRQQHSLLSIGGAVLALGGFPEIWTWHLWPGRLRFEPRMRGGVGDETGSRRRSLLA